MDEDFSPSGHYTRCVEPWRRKISALSTTLDQWAEDGKSSEVDEDDLDSAVRWMSRLLALPHLGDRLPFLGFSVKLGEIGLGRQRAAEIVCSLFLISVDADIFVFFFGKSGLLQLP